MYFRWKQCKIISISKFKYEKQIIFSNKNTMSFAEDVSHMLDTAFKKNPYNNPRRSLSLSVFIFPILSFPTETQIKLLV